MSGKQLFLLVIVLLAAFLALDSVFVVDQREKVLVFQLGQIKRADSEPGLHFKLPLVQNVRAFDSRVLTLEADAEEYLYGKVGTSGNGHEWHVQVTCQRTRKRRPQGRDMVNVLTEIRYTTSSGRQANTWKIFLISDTDFPGSMRIR